MKAHKTSYLHLEKLMTLLTKTSYKIPIHNNMLPIALKIKILRKTVVESTHLFLNNTDFQVKKTEFQVLDNIQ